jgi:hypothetical protein
MTVTLEYENYDIIMLLTETNVTIKIIEKRIQDDVAIRIYENTYDEKSINKFGIGSLIKFYTICLKCLGKLNNNSQEDDLPSENISIKLFDELASQIIIDMYYKKDTVIKIKLELPLTEIFDLSSDQNKIKKLTDEMKECRKQLKECLERIKVLENMNAKS